MAVRGACRRYVCVCVYLINMVELEVFEEQQQQSRDGLDDDFLVTVHINSQFHALKDCDAGGHTYKHTQRQTNCKAFRCLITIQLCLSKDKTHKRVFALL